MKKFLVIIGFVASISAPAFADGGAAATGANANLPCTAGSGQTGANAVQARTVKPNDDGSCQAGYHKSGTVCVIDAQ